jgi:hypothetical protein
MSALGSEELRKLAQLLADSNKGQLNHYVCLVPLIAARPRSGRCGSRVGLARLSVIT